MIDFVPFDQIGLRDIERLRDDEVAEGRTIEYKDEDPTVSGDSKRDFRACVTSFANTDGGDLIYGVKADKAKAVIVDIPGLKVASRDSFEQTLNHTLRDQVDPRISPVRFRWVDLGAGRAVVVVRVQPSWVGPHAATRSFIAYYQRTSNGKQPMDAHELRNAFLLAGRAEERFEKFCDERHTVLLGEHIIDHGPQPLVNLSDGAILAIHAAPLAAMARPVALDIRANVERLREIRPYRAVEHHPITGRPNVEGYLAAVSSDLPYTYWQVFRTGPIEAVSVFEPRRASGSSSTDSPPVLNAGWFERTAVGEVTTILKLLATLGYSAPTLLCLALLKASKFALQLGSHYEGRAWGSRLFERKFIPLGTCVVEEQTPDVAAILRPIFDTFCNAVGLEGSRNYNPEGKWQPPRD